MEPAGDDGQHAKDSHHEELGDEERRLTAFWGQGMQGGNLCGELGDEDEDIGVQGDGGGDGVRFAPGAIVMFYLASGNCHGEEDQRNDAQNDTGRYFVKRK
jgi:hypothetical protein